MVLSVTEAMSTSFMNVYEKQIPFDMEQEKLSHQHSAVDNCLPETMEDARSTSWIG